MIKAFTGLGVLAMAVGIVILLWTSIEIMQREQDPLPSANARCGSSANQDIREWEVCVQDELKKSAVEWGRAGLQVGSLALGSGMILLSWLALAFRIDTLRPLLTDFVPSVEGVSWMTFTPILAVAGITTVVLISLCLLLLTLL
jgi:hypothetical protein